MTTPSVLDPLAYDRHADSSGAAGVPGSRNTPASDAKRRDQPQTTDYRSPSTIAVGIYLLVLLVLLVDTTVRIWPAALPTAAVHDALERRALGLENRARSDSDSVSALIRLPAQNQDTAALRRARLAFAASRDRAVAARRIADEADAQAAVATITPATLSLLFGRVTIPGISFDVRLILLAMVLGGLGSFIHIAQSFATHVGEKTLSLSWTIWYVLRPFIGGALAAVLYFAIRGAFFPTSTSLSGELSPFGVAGIAALTGMFSQHAANKLNEVFKTMFQTSDTKRANDARDEDEELNGGPTQTSKPDRSDSDVSGERGELLDPATAGTSQTKVGSEDDAAG